MRAPHVLALIAHFNVVSMWVASAVVAEAELKERAAAFAHFVEVATHCVELRNYNAAQEVSAGLALAAVHRLKVTTRRCPPRPSRSTTLCKRSSPSTATARRTATRCSATPPCIPYLGVYLTDLTFIEDGNKDEVEVEVAAPPPPTVGGGGRRRRRGADEAHADQLGEASEVRGGDRRHEILPAESIQPRPLGAAPALSPPAPVHRAR